MVRICLDIIVQRLKRLELGYHRLFQVSVAKTGSSLCRTFKGHPESCLRRMGLNQPFTDKKREPLAKLSRSATLVFFFCLTK